jgi:hypothetical protein
MANYWESISATHYSSLRKDWAENIRSRYLSNNVLSKLITTIGESLGCNILPVLFSFPETCINQSASWTALPSAPQRPQALMLVLPHLSGLPQQSRFLMISFSPLFHHVA